MLQSPGSQSQTRLSDWTTALQRVCDRGRGSVRGGFGGGTCSPDCREAPIYQRHHAGPPRQCPTCTISHLSPVTALPESLVGRPRQLPHSGGAGSLPAVQASQRTTGPQSPHRETGVGAEIDTLRRVTKECRPLGSPAGADSEEPACQCRRRRGVGSVPGSRRPPGGGNSHTLRDSSLGNSVDRGAWRGLEGHALESQSQTGLK